MCLKLTGDRKLTRFLKLTHLDVVDGVDVIHAVHNNLSATWSSDLSVRDLAFRVGV